MLLVLRAPWRSELAPGALLNAPGSTPPPERGGATERRVGVDDFGDSLRDRCEVCGAILRPGRVVESGDTVTASYRCRCGREWRTSYLREAIG